MKSLLVVCWILAAFSPLSFAASADDQAARAAAVRYLALLDAHQFETAWQGYAPRIKAGGKKQEYLDFMRARRVPLGKAQTRAYLKVKHMTQLAGAPDGNYMVIYFKSSFEHKAVAVERVTLTSETGHWQVSGYGFR